jgi:transposase
VPRKSPYTVTLKAKERKQLEALARQYTSPYCYVVRAKIALYAAAGLRNDEIGARLDTPRQIVSKWRKRFAEEGLEGLRARPRRGATRVAKLRHPGHK